MKVKTKVKLFPAIGKFVKGAYVKVDNEQSDYNNKILKVHKILEFTLTLIDSEGFMVNESKRNCTLHKAYVTTNKIIAELNYIDCEKIDINSEYDFEISTINTRARIGDVIKIHKVKLCDFIYDKVKIGIVSEILNNGEYKIILNDNSEVICKRHMFKCESDIKYIAKLWTS
jgi:hypothetical protein